MHVNALTREDWSMWIGALRENPAVRHVCKEFQTGLRDAQRASEALDGLSRLQDGVGRALHPLIVGGRRVSRTVGERFASFTVVDSVPFLVTMHRKRISIDGHVAVQLDNPTSPGESLDILLQDNIRTYRKLVSLSAASDGIDVSGALDEYEDGGEPELT
jgi:hypothetical protein